MDMASVFNRLHALALKFEMTKQAQCICGFAIQQEKCCFAIYSILFCISMLQKISLENEASIDV